MQGRVGGQLAVTRALGDHHLKTSVNSIQGVSAEPYVSREVITANELFAVIASDGLWDVVQNHDLLEYRGGKNSLEIATALLNRALQSGSRDNISVLVMCF